jgi:hypothetical protein
MGEISTYQFNQTDLRGGFSFANLGFFTDMFSESWANVAPGSILTIQRPSDEYTIDLYSWFNATDFLTLIDVTPLIGGMTVNNNPDALMVMISIGMTRYVFRTSDIRAGWDMWTHVPYYSKDPARHQPGDLLNQLAVNFHVNRGKGTVDNDGWIALYYMFFLDSEGRLGANVDGWAYEYGGGGGLQDDAPDLSAVLEEVIPAFATTVQSFLDKFCLDAMIFQNGLHDSSGRALFDYAYLLPGDGNSDLGPVQEPSGYPAPGTGISSRPIDVEVTLALVPKQPPPPPSPPQPPLQISVRGENVRAGNEPVQTTRSQPRENSAATKGSGLTDLPDRARQPQSKESTKGSGLTDVSNRTRQPLRKDK